MLYLYCFILYPGSEIFWGRSQTFQNPAGIVERVLQPGCDPTEKCNKFCSTLAKTKENLGEVYLCQLLCVHSTGVVLNLVTKVGIKVVIKRQPSY